MESWQCTDCGATVQIDMDSVPIQCDYTYPVTAGPYASVPIGHRCPIKNGLLPEQLADASNARRVS